MAASREVVCGRSGDELGADMSIPDGCGLAVDPSTICSSSASDLHGQVLAASGTDASQVSGRLRPYATPICRSVP